MARGSRARVQRSDSPRPPVRRVTGRPVLTSLKPPNRHIRTRSLSDAGDLDGIMPIPRPSGTRAPRIIRWRRQLDVCPNAEVSVALGHLSTDGATSRWPQRSNKPRSPKCPVGRPSYRHYRLMVLALGWASSFYRTCHALPRLDQVQGTVLHPRPGAKVAPAMNAACRVTR